MNLEQLRSRPTITVAELADVLSCGKNQAYDAVRAGLVPSLRVGAAIRIPTPALLRVLGDFRTDMSDGPGATPGPLATTDDPTEAHREARPSSECGNVRTFRNAG